MISDYHMANIAQDLADWEEIASSILLSESEQKEIKEDYQGRYKLQKRQALRVWHNKSGNKATYKALLNIFQSENHVFFRSERKNSRVKKKIPSAKNHWN